MNSPLHYVALATLALGCAGDTAIDLELVPDPNVNDEAEIMRRITVLRTIVDTESGLYTPSEENSQGVVQIVNADSDEALELVALVPLEDRLPLVRFEQADLPDVPLDIRFLGEDASGVVAEGRVRGVRFAGGISTVQIPFNIRPDRLPPRVTEVYPPDASTIVGCTPPVLVVFFSKPVDRTTVFADGAVLINGMQPAAIRMPSPALSAEIIAPTEIMGDGERLRYTLALGTSILDTEGQSLDQVAGETLAQEFRAEFSMFCTPPPSMPPPPFCGEPGATTNALCPGAPRFVCVDGFCSPRDDGSGCEGSLCENGTVCDPALGRCTFDCRPFGDTSVCPDERPVCDSDSGVCVL